jgi:hypothetical protein
VPNPIHSPPASALAIKLGWESVENSLAPLAEAISELGPQSPVLSEFSLVPPGTVESQEAVLARGGEMPYGLPLLDACLPKTVPPEQNLTDLFPVAAGEIWSTTLEGIDLPGMSVTLA